MGEALRRRLDDLVKRPITSPDEGRLVEEAARLLTMLLEIEQRVADLEGGNKPAARVAEQAPGYGANDFTSLPLHEAARRVLGEAGFPMHSRDLAVRLIARGWRGRGPDRPKPARLADQLAARLPRHPAFFVRVRPNTFALVGMDLDAKRPVPRLGVFEGPVGFSAADLDRTEPFETNPPWPS